MSYEFVDEGPEGELPQAPNFWRDTPDEVGKLPPNQIYWVHHESITYDSASSWFGIDTKDRLHDWLPSAVRVYVMRVAYMDDANELKSGFLVDFRNRTWSHVYGSLPFHDPTEGMQARETEPVLGMAFRDDKGEQYFRAYCDRDLLMERAQEMIKEIDEGTKRAARLGVAEEAGKQAMDVVFLVPKSQRRE